MALEKYKYGTDFEDKVICRKLVQKLYIATLEKVERKIVEERVK